jgi:undecaprenyl diphosphate synthase
MCVGIIMDGNRRWAKARGLPAFAGHRAGYEKLYDVVSWVAQAGIGYGIFYAFSTENWKRSREEVSYLEGLIGEMAARDMEKLVEKGVRVHCIGERERFSERTQRALREVEEGTKGGTRVTMLIALSYGGRAEIVRAAQRLCREGARDFTEEDFAAHLYTKDVPDPDFIIRTGGDTRLSNFLTWQSVYSELFFTTTHWPDFSKEEFDRMVEEYRLRDRRRGA